MYECPRLPNCAKLTEIRSLDPDKYDIDGLVGDICWLCDEKPEGAIHIKGTGGKDDPGGRKGGALR